MPLILCTRSGGTGSWRDTSSPSTLHAHSQAQTYNVELRSIALPLYILVYCIQSLLHNTAYTAVAISHVAHQLCGGLPPPLQGCHVPRQSSRLCAFHNTADTRTCCCCNGPTPAFHGNQ